MKHNTKLNLVWFLCRTKAIANAVQTQAEKVGDARRYYVSSWSEFQEQSGNTLLSNNRDQFRLRDLVPCH